MVVCKKCGKMWHVKGLIAEVICSKCARVYGYNPISGKWDKPELEQPGDVHIQ